MKAVFASIYSARRLANVKLSVPSISTALYHTNVPLFKRRGGGDDDDIDEEKLFSELKNERVKRDMIRPKYYEGGLIDAAPIAYPSDGSPVSKDDDLDFDDDDMDGEPAAPRTIAQAMHFESIDTRNVQIDHSKEFVFEIEREVKVQIFHFK